MTTLTQREKNQCKVVLALLVTSLLIQRVGQAVFDPEKPGDLPAVAECVAMIDDIFQSVPEDRRELMIARIQEKRVVLTKRTGNMDISGAMVGALQYLTSGVIKSKPGTRLDFIITSFDKNLETLRNTIPEQNVTARRFQTELAKAINSI